MPTLRTVQNRLQKIKTEIMEIEASIRRAEQAGKPHFANRLRLMIEAKLKKINSLVGEG